MVELPADTLFAFDVADLSPGAQANLAKAAELVRGAPPGAVAVTGYTDAKGDAAYNQRLSERRAAAVAQWMRAQPGVRQRAFTVAGKGETAPVVPNTVGKRLTGTRSKDQMTICCAVRRQEGSTTGSIRMPARA